MGQSITGTVLDEQTEEPIPGVNIMAIGTNTGTITDMNGEFELNLPSETAQFQFSFIGYDNQILDVQAGENYRVMLIPGDLMLEDVIVVGYGTQQKKNLTGAVSSVNVEESLENRSITDVGKALQGVSAGLTVTQVTGDIGQDANLNLRGMNGSLNTEANPLILVDNVEVSSLSMINPDDIKEISVLKDAASASIYGARGV